MFGEVHVEIIVLLQSLRRNRAVPRRTLSSYRHCRTEETRSAARLTSRTYDLSLTARLVDLQSTLVRQETRRNKDVVEETKSDCLADSSSSALSSVDRASRILGYQLRLTNDALGTLTFHFS